MIQVSFLGSKFKVVDVVMWSRWRSLWKMKGRRVDVKCFLYELLALRKVKCKEMCLFWDQSNLQKRFFPRRVSEAGSEREIGNWPLELTRAFIASR